MLDLKVAFKIKGNIGAKRRVNRSLGGNIAVIIALAIFGAFMALPLIYSIINAFKPLEEFYIFPPRFFAVNPTTNNFLDLFDLATSMWVPFSRYLFNSVFVTSATVSTYVLIASACAYPLAKHEFMGKNVLNAVIVTSMMFTSTVMGIPQYILMSKIGMVDTYFAIIIPALGSTMGVFLMRQFMVDFPMSIIESARLEGAGEFQVFWKIVMPSQRPAWITIMIFTFQAVWGASASNMVFTENIKVLPQMLSQIASGGIARAGVAAAAGVILLIPNILFFIFCQSNILETMSSSGIKE